MKRYLVPLLIAALSVTSNSIAHAETDPFPSVALGGEIGSRQILNSQGNPVDGSAPISCPTGSGSSIVSNVTTKETYAVCVKTWRPSAEVDADRAFQSAQESARATAEAESIAWNAAHPGQQKCVQWGPIVHANGISTASGGVCANVVPLLSISDTGTVISNPTPTDSATPVLASAPMVESSTPVITTIVETTTTPTLATVQTSTPIHTGLGGYAVVHPDGHVCGVIVGTSSDPFNNGGTMPVEYMGCPAGSRIVFQTTPSTDGNVAGWHGDNVKLQGDTFVINNGTSSIAVTSGVATDSTTGRTWDTGTGNILKEGNVETKTVASDTTTVLSETTTVLAQTSPAPILITETPTVLSAPIPSDIETLPEVVAEEEVTNSVDAVVINNKTRVEVATEWENTRLSVTATKKGSKKKYTYRFTTDDQGNYLFKSSVNLKGFTLILFKGIEELDRVQIY